MGGVVPVGAVKITSMRITRKTNSSIVDTTSTHIPVQCKRGYIVAYKFPFTLNGDVHFRVIFYWRECCIFQRIFREAQRIGLIVSGRNGVVR